MAKKLIAALLALVMIIGLLPIIPASTTAYATGSGKCGKNLSWVLDSAGTLTITGYGEMENYTNTVHAPWYDQRKSIKNIVLTNSGGGITNIGDYAFYFCSNLTDLTLPSTLRTVGDNSFESCEKLKDFSLPESVTKIGYYAFCNCDSLTKVPSDSKLKNVYSLGSGVFFSCSGLKEAVIPPLLTKVPGCIYIGCIKIETVVIPENIKTIGSQAFAWCDSLKTVVLNTGVTYVENFAFEDCTSLKTVYISNGLTMEKDAFKGCPTSTNFYIELSNSDFNSSSNINSTNASYKAANHYYKTHSAVVLHPNGGTGGEFGETGMPYVFIKNAGGSFTVSGSNSYLPTRPGIGFLSWNTKPDGSGTTYKPGDTYRGNTVLNLYAQWDESHIHRLSGSTRNGTAAAISKEVEIERDGCSAVVLANGWNFADALAGGPLAYALDAPILLITGDDSDTETYAEIERLGVEKVYILGGTGAVGKDVEDKLKKDGYNVRRIAGNNRYETAVKIAEEIDVLWDDYSDTAVFAYSYNYPDALAVSGAAATEGIPILYIDSNGLLDPATEAYVNKCKFKKAYILGGMYAISLVAESSITSAGAKSTERIAGVTRYETCIDINRKFASSFKTFSICVSTGVNFPDALAGGVLAASKACPMLLVAPDESLSETQKNYIRQYFNGNKGEAFIFGGKVAVPEAIENELKRTVPKVSAY